VRRNHVSRSKVCPSTTLDISIDGDTAVAFTEDVSQRYLAYGWQVLHVRDGDQLNYIVFLEFLCLTPVQ
jgi:hypothetical protein